MNQPRRALVVIDVQNEYFTGQLPIEHPPVSQSLPNITRAMDAAAEAGIPVVVVQHRTAPGVPVFDPETDGFQLHPEVARRPHQHHIVKQMASVFAGTDLDAWLAAHEIDTVSLVGYMTHNCGVSTALQASHQGLHVEYLADASGSLPYENAAGRASAEEIHRTFTVVLHSNFAAVTSTADWLIAVSQGERLQPDNVALSNRRARERRAA